MFGSERQKKNMSAGKSACGEKSASIKKKNLLRQVKFRLSAKLESCNESEEVQAGRSGEAEANPRAHSVRPVTQAPVPHGAAFTAGRERVGRVALASNRETREQGEVL